MSAELMGAVLYLDLPAQRKLILVAMADNANEAGRCWPSQALIALKSSITPRRLRDHLKALEADGWMAVLDSGQGRGMTGQYLLDSQTIRQVANLRRLNMKKGDKGDVVAHAPDVIGDVATEKGDGVAEKGDTSVLQNPKETLGEPSMVKGLAFGEAVQEIVEAVGGGYAVVHLDQFGDAFTGADDGSWQAEDEREEFRSAEVQLEGLIEDQASIPPWVKIFRAGERFQYDPDPEWVAQIEATYERHPDHPQNLYLVSTNCYKWLITHPKGKKRDTWEGTLEPWLKKNLAQSKREAGEGETDGQLGEGGGGASKYTRQKAELG